MYLDLELDLSDEVLGDLIGVSEDDLPPRRRRPKAAAATGATHAADAK